VHRGIFQEVLSRQETQARIQILSAKYVSHAPLDLFDGMLAVQEWYDEPLKLPKRMAFELDSPSLGDKMKDFVSGVVRRLKPDVIVGGDRGFFIFGADTVATFLSRPILENRETQVVAFHLDHEL
jgi:hypothetical protein